MRNHRGELFQHDCCPAAGEGDSGAAGAARRPTTSPAPPARGKGALTVKPEHSQEGKAAQPGSASCAWREAQRDLRLQLLGESLPWWVVETRLGLELLLPRVAEEGN